MYKVDGKNDFENNIFDFWKWSAPMLQSPEEVRIYFNSLNVTGKKVIGLSLCTNAYFFDRQWTEEVVYRNCSDDMTREEKIKASELESIDTEFQYNRVVTVDEPISIMFDDGDVFTVDLNATSEVRMGVNEVPWNIKDKYHTEKEDINLLFAPVIGSKITGIEVISGKGYNFEPHGDEWRNQTEFTEAFIIWFDNDTGLIFEIVMLDYTEIALIDRNRCCLKVPFRTYYRCMTEVDKEKDDIVE